MHLHARLECRWRFVCNLFIYWNKAGIKWQRTSHGGAAGMQLRASQASQPSGKLLGARPPRSFIEAFTESVQPLSCECGLIREEIHGVAVLARVGLDLDLQFNLAV
jgi:hypothetical protein